MRLAIFTHVIHQNQEGKYFAYSPYIREMNIWLKYVGEVEVLGPAFLPRKEEYLMNDAYRHPRLIFSEIPSFNVLDIKSIFQSILKIPIIIFKMAGAMKRADHLHLRCPGNIGLLACICQIFFPHKPKTAKYAGNWDPESKQSWTYKVQKWILSNTFLTRNMTVLVYGDWPNESNNVLPFFTASFSEAELKRNEKDFGPSFKFLFVGNLVAGKKPLFAVELVEALIEKNINAELHVYGDGEKMDTLKRRAGNKSYIHVYGNKPLHVLKKAYQESHFLVLASKSEGWPKAVAEAMFFGCIPIATGVSCVPWMLDHGNRGILIPPVPQEGAEYEEWINKIIIDFENLIENKEEIRRMSLAAQEWSHQFTLEKFEEAIKMVLITPT